jgi:hypothetical protein
MLLILPPSPPSTPRLDRLTHLTSAKDCSVSAPICYRTCLMHAQTYIHFMFLFLCLAMALLWGEYSRQQSL